MQKLKRILLPSTLGLKVIGVESISIEAFGGFPPSPPQHFLAKQAVEAAPPTAGPPSPVIAGEQEVTSTVDIVYLIG